jgi:3-deoxy-manno-octulosonate cytidylyltransferase (CMP-KDO synthetase)
MRRGDYATASVILNVQGDEPFVSREALAGAVGVVQSGLAPIGTAAVLASPDVLVRPDVVKVVRTDAGHALYFSRAPIPFLRDSQDASVLQGIIRQHIGVYAYTREALARWVSWSPHPLELTERLEQLRPLANGLAIGVADVPSAEGGIDTEEDLARANARWSILIQSDTPS